MAVATFDTLKFANTLKASGVPEKQAEAQAVAFAEVIHLNFKELVTKDDLSHAVKELRQEIQQSGKEIRLELQQTTKDGRQELQQTAKDLRQEIRQASDDQKNNLKEESLKINSKIDTIYAKLVGEMTLLKWMFGVNITVMIGILIRLFAFRTP